MSLRRELNSRMLALAQRLLQDSGGASTLLSSRVMVRAATGYTVAQVVNAINGNYSDLAAEVQSYLRSACPLCVLPTVHAARLAPAVAVPLLPAIISAGPPPKAPQSEPSSESSLPVAGIAIGIAVAGCCALLLSSIIFVRFSGSCCGVTACCVSLATCCGACPLRIARRRKSLIMSRAVLAAGHVRSQDSTMDHRVASGVDVAPINISNPLAAALSLRSNGFKISMPPPPPPSRTSTEDSYFADVANPLAASLFQRTLSVKPSTLLPTPPGSLADDARVVMAPMNPRSGQTAYLKASPAS